MHRVGSEPLRGVQEGDLGLVPVGFDPVHVLVRLAAVSGRVDVSAPDEQQSVERLEDLLGLAPLAWGQDRRPRTGSAQGVEVEPGTP